MFTSKAFNALRNSQPLQKTWMRNTVRVFSQDNFLNGQNANYIDAMYSQWQKDPNSVHASWNAYFQGANYEHPPTLGKNA